MPLPLHSRLPLVLVAWAALLGGCAQVHVGSHLIKRAQAAQGCAEVGANKIGNPYIIDGIRYTPRTSSAGFAEEGIASWYGDDFHGKPTANGECYNMYAFTAAHKELPLPTVVRVTNLENNKSVVVKVNDRGPFVAGRIIDLSYAAAQSIGMVGKGTVPVRVEALGGAFHGDGRWTQTAQNLQLGPGAAPPPLPSTVPSTVAEEELLPVSPRQILAERRNEANLGVPPANPRLPEPPTYEERVATDTETLENTLVYVQVGAFGDVQRAEATQLRLGKLYPTAHVSVMEAAGRPLSRVRAGPFRSVADAELALLSIRQNGWPTAQVVVERR